jgi:YegS/Rv2252/BmrU family lipid kinase
MRPLSTWLIVVNPVAGTGKGAKIWDKILQHFQGNIETQNVLVTDRESSISERLPSLLHSGLKNICVVGGDGTLHSVVNTIYRNNFHLEEFKFFQIPVGTGNDWIKSHGVNRLEPIQLFKCLTKGTQKEQSLGLITYGDRKQQSKEIFVNMTGLGFSGDVVRNTVERQWMKKSGALGYLVSLIYSLAGYTNKWVSITTDTIKDECELFHMSIGIGKYAGGGMMFCPMAIPSDRNFAISRVQKISRFKVIRNLLGLFNGNYVALKEVSTYKASQVIIKSDKPIPVESDGEFLGEHQLVKIQIIDTPLIFLVP